MKNCSNWISSLVLDEAELLQIDINQIVDDSNFSTDIEWSSNDWSNKKSQVQCAADAIIIRKNKIGDFQVLMIEREIGPFCKGFALPGGMKDACETYRETVIREMEEEVDINLVDCLNVKELGLVKADDWDPRFAMGVYVYGMVFQVPYDVKFKAGDDAKSAQWIDVNDLANGKYNIAFVHSFWLALAFQEYKELFKKFNFIIKVSRIRNHKLIKLINNVREQNFGINAVRFPVLKDFNIPYTVEKLA